MFRQLLHRNMKRAKKPPSLPTPHPHLNLAVSGETLEEVPRGLVPVRQEVAPVDAVEYQVEQHVHQ